MGVLTPFFNLFKPAKTDPLAVDRINADLDIIDSEMHKPPLTVNGILPDPDTRNIKVESVPLADNLTSDEAQYNQGEFLTRTTGGSTPVSDGAAALSTIRGNMIKTGYVPESITMAVNAVPRVAPPAITATIDISAFESYVQTAGTYTLTYTDSWSASPADYGVSVQNTPIYGDNIVIEWDGENDPVMTVNAVERTVPGAITASLDEDTFREYVQSSGTVALSYTSTWSANPALYGITVHNTPAFGDSIVVVYVKENRGTLTPANVSAFHSTGWNLYDSATGYARVVRYSDDYGYKIGGTYSLVNFALTPTGSQSAISVDANGYFNVPQDGFVVVTGGNETTYVYATHTDWTEGYEGEFEGYTETTVDLSGIMVLFSNGLLAVGDIRDEINFNTRLATSRITRMEYTTENLELVKASGRPYDTDTGYIYTVRASYVEETIQVDGDFTASDHGIEYYTAATTTPPITQVIYGNNLKDKLRTDVLTISQQTLTPAQQNQARANISAAKSVLVNMGTISSLPLTKSAPGVTGKMVVATYELGTPSAQTGDWTVTTDTNSVTLSGSIAPGGSTTVKLVLIEQDGVTATTPES